MDRRKKYMLQYTAISQIGYLIPFIACVGARYFEKASYTYWECIFTELLALGTIIFYLALILEKREISRGFVNRIYLSQFLMWSGINVYLVSWMNEIRDLNLLFCFIALVFLIGQTSLVLSFFVPILATLSYFVGSYLGINYLNQSGDIFSICLNAIIFLIIATFISLIVRQQRMLLKRARTKTEMAYDELEIANQKLEQLTQLDGLTSIYNRRYFDMRLKELWNVYSRLKHPVSIILIDIDYFKKFNDTYGHQAGDLCLCSVASALKEQAMRSSDVVARYGGEEFVVIACTDIDDALKLAEKMRLAVQALSIQHKLSKIKTLSISLGIASVVPSKNMEMTKLIENADNALYKSKENGRNMVSVSKNI